MGVTSARDVREECKQYRVCFRSDDLLNFG
jgi:hypothetical protein